MSEYAIERAGKGRRAMDMEHCENHEKNTTDLASLKSGIATLKWVMGLSIPAMVTLMLYASKANTEQLTAIQTDIKSLTTLMSASSVADAINRSELDQVKKDVDELKVLYRNRR